MITQGLYAALIRTRLCEIVVNDDGGGVEIHSEPEHGPFGMGWIGNDFPIRAVYEKIRRFQYRLAD